MLTDYQPGAYYLHVKSWSKNVDTDSIFYGTNGEPVTWNDGGVVKSRSFSLRCGGWGWSSSPTTIVVDSDGPQTVDLWIREGGARIDQLFVSSTSETPTPLAEMCE